MSTIKYYFYYLDSLFIGHPFVVRIAIVIIMLLVFLYLLAMVSILITVRRRKRTIKRRKKIRDQYEDLIKDILYTKDEMPFDNIKEKLEIEDEKSSFKKWELVHITELLNELKKNKHNEFEYE